MAENEPRKKYEAFPRTPEGLVTAILENDQALLDAAMFPENRARVEDAVRNTLFQAKNTLAQDTRKGSVKTQAEATARRFGAVEAHFFADKPYGAIGQGQEQQIKAGRVGTLVREGIDRFQEMLRGSTNPTYQIADRDFENLRELILQVAPDSLSAQVIRAYQQRRDQQQMMDMANQVMRNGYLELGLEVGIINTLLRHGITREQFESMTHAQRLKIKGLGEASIKKIVEKIEKFHQMQGRRDTPEE